MQTKIKNTTIRSNDAINKNKLKKYLIDKYGNDIIVASEDVPDKDPTIYINKNKFYDITYKTFFEIKSSYRDDYITLDQLIDFLLNKGNGGANTNATCGKYHEFMSMVFELCNVSVENGLPNYQNVNQIIREKIIPLREEYLICWWILYKISNDPLIKEFLFVDGKFYAWPKFQENYNGRYYDVSFDELGIVIEIQEDKSAHKNSLNDKLKESIVKIEAKRIKYFKMQEYNASTYDYLDDFWKNTLKKSLVEALLYKSYDARKKFCSYRFIEICTEEKNMIDSELFELYQVLTKIESDSNSKQNNSNHDANIKNKRYEILKKKSNKLDIFINGAEPSLIDMLFAWRDKSEKNNNQYVVDMNGVSIFLGKQSNEIRKLVDFMYENGILFKTQCINDDCETFITWQSLVELLKMDEIKIMEKSIVMRLDLYLINIEKIYEEIIIKIKSHTTEIINNCLINNAEYYEYIKQKIEEPLIKQIKKLTDESETNQFEIKHTCKIAKKLIKIAKKQNDICLQISSLKKNKKYNDEIQSLTDELTNYYNNNVGKVITIQKIIGKSIIKEMPYFPIVYTGRTENKISYYNFAGICKAYSIPPANQKKICQGIYENYDIEINTITTLHYIEDISDDNTNVQFNERPSIDEILRTTFNFDLNVKASSNSESNSKSDHNIDSDLEFDSELNKKTNSLIGTNCVSDSEDEYDF
jgi:hypothetical protein